MGISYYDVTQQKAIYKDEVLMSWSWQTNIQMIHEPPTGTDYPSRVYKSNVSILIITLGVIKAKALASYFGHSSYTCIMILISLYTADIYAS